MGINPDQNWIDNDDDDDDDDDDFVSNPTSCPRLTGLLCLKLI